MSLRPLHNPRTGVVRTPHCDRATNSRFSVDMLSKTNRTAIVESWDIRTALAQLSHGCRAVPVQYPWNRTDIAQSSYVNPTAVAPWPCGNREMYKLFVGVFVDVFRVNVFSCIRIRLNFSIKRYHLSVVGLRISDFSRGRWVEGSRRALQPCSSWKSSRQERGAERERSGSGDGSPLGTSTPWCMNWCISLYSLCTEAAQAPYDSTENLRRLCGDCTEIARLP